MNITPRFASRERAFDIFDEGMLRGARRAASRRRIHFHISICAKRPTAVSAYHFLATMRAATWRTRYAYEN